MTPTPAQIEALKKDLITPYPTPEFANDVFLRALKVINQLIAAAQVGETHEEYLARTFSERWTNAKRKATIERCAQVAEKDGWHKAADAIRNLKSEEHREF